MTSHAGRVTCRCRLPSVVHTMSWQPAAQKSSVVLQALTSHEACVSATCTAAFSSQVCRRAAGQQLFDLYDAATDHGLLSQTLCSRLIMHMRKQLSLNAAAVLCAAVASHMQHATSCSHLMLLGWCVCVACTPLAWLTAMFEDMQQSALCSALRTAAGHSTACSVGRQPVPASA